MKKHVEVLRAILRCSRHRRTADHAALRLRVECTERELERALAKLVGDGLVYQTPRGAMALTLAGLAVAAATLPPVSKKRAASKARSAA